MNNSKDNSGTVAGRGKKCDFPNTVEGTVSISQCLFQSVQIGKHSTSITGCPFCLFTLGYALFRVVCLFVNWTQTLDYSGKRTLN